jgi:arginine decarboxylase
MNVSFTERFTTDDAVNIYGLDGWGNGYFAIGEDGHLLVTPTREPARSIDVFRVVEDLAKRGIKSPVLLRFPQLLEGQVNELVQSFANAIREYNYRERYHPVFPIKVNQQRSVVDGLVRSGWTAGLGLEAGSRPELLAAVALDLSPDALVICNGFKDQAYLQMASTACRLGKQVVVVIEKPFEVDQILEMAAREPVLFKIGFRIRLQAKGSGMWEKSGGFTSKFGLTTLQLLRALEKLTASGLRSQLALLHFHIGSQITEIRKLKTAVREAARIYAKVRKLGADVSYLDVGGGLGIDYDGSKTSSDASVNYSVQEYANDVVFGIQEVCDEEHVPPPRIVSESGRMLVAYHAMLITDVRAAVSGQEPDPPALTGREAQVVQDLADAAKKISVKNYREFYHDAIEYRDQMYSLFNLGMLGLEERGKGEVFFREVAMKAVRYSKSAKFVADEFQELETKLHDKYICNFSVFQSVPDHWALDQLFPIIPVHRLNEPPTRKATLADITCDSDGEVEKFVDLKDIKDALEVHELKDGEPYFLAFALVGAYQDTMGDMHNLFGRVNEAEVILGPKGTPVVTDVRRGEPGSETLASFGYDGSDLTEAVKAQLRERTNRGEISADDAAEILENYTSRLAQYTYLD